MKVNHCQLKQVVPSAHDYGELGKQCRLCGEWWPPDEEFYYPGFAQCKACYLERKYAKRRAGVVMAKAGPSNGPLKPMYQPAQ